MAVLSYCIYESLYSALYLHPEENIHIKPFITAFFIINMQIKRMSVLGKKFRSVYKSDILKQDCLCKFTSHLLG